MQGDQTQPPPSLHAFDARDFPLVRYAIPETLSSGGEDPMLRDFELLLSRGAPFVIISTGEHDREPQPVRAARATWFKRNRSRTGQWCKAMIHIEPEDGRRAPLLLHQQPVGEAMGVAFHVVADPGEAEAIARTALGADLAQPTPLEREISSLLERFQSLLLARDFDALEGLMAEGFTYAEIDGSTLDRQSLLARERQGASARPQTEVSHRLLCARKTGVGAEALVVMGFRTVLGEGSGEVVFEGSGRERVTLTRAGGAWLFQRVAIEDQRLTRNGVPAGAEAIEEMHRGR
ncbi:MAG: nuclear transport factor 2 family protein [Pseudomonadota bacterium]